MALTVPAQWTDTEGDQDSELLVTCSPGDWLAAIVVSRVVDGSAPTLAVGDMSRNMWTLISDPFQFASAAHAGAQLRAEIWACPAARFDGWPWLLVYSSAMQITAPDVGSLCVDVVKVTGMTGQLTVESVTLTTASAANSITLTAPAPSGSANCLFLAAAAGDIAYGSYTTTGTGWAQLNSVVRSGPELGLFGAWREGTTGSGVTFSLAGGFNRNWAGVVVALRTSGTVLPQPNPAWPPTQLQLGIGYDMSTPLSRVRWTDQTSRYLSLNGSRGVQAELGTAQQGQAVLTLRNDDGALSPRPVAEAASASAAGTATTIKVPDASATAIHVADFFRLRTSAGALKELNVFQVTSLSSAAGTTTITFKRADGTPGGALGATASGDVYAGIAIDLYIPWRLCKTVAGTTYIVASGWLKDLPLAFDDAHYSTVQAQGADALEPLQAVANPSALRGEIYRRPALYAYWPLDDAAGTGYAANQSGTSASVLTRTVSKYGAGANTSADFGASTQDIVAHSNGTTTSLLGDPGSGWAQSGQTAAEMATQGYALVGSDPAMPLITGGVTIFGAIEITDAQMTLIGSAAANPTVCIIRNTDPGAGGQGAIIKITINRTAPFYPIVTVWDKATHVSTATTASSGSSFTGGAWLTWALAFDQTSWTLYLDGGVAGSGSCNLVSAWSTIDVGGEADQFFHGRTFPATHAHIAVFGRKITLEEATRLNDSAVFGWFRFANEKADMRIQKKLAAGSWKNTRILNTGVAALAPEAAPSGSVANLAAEVAGYEDSDWFVDAATQVQYRNRVTAYHQAPRATLGENAAAGEIPYQPGQVFDYGTTFLYNDVEITNTTEGGYTRLATNTYVAVDDTSTARYGSRTLARATRYGLDSSAWHIGWWLLAMYAYPRQRVGTVVVSAAATSDTARWAFVCGVEVGDIVMVTRRPIGQPAITIRCQVLNVAPEFSRQASGQVAGQVTLTLAAAPFQVAIADDATYGVVGGTVLGA